MDGGMDASMVSIHPINRVYIVSEDLCSRWAWAGTATRPTEMCVHVISNNQPCQSISMIVLRVQVV